MTIEQQKLAIHKRLKEIELEQEKLVRELKKLTVIEQEEVCE